MKKRRVCFTFVPLGRRSHRFIARGGFGCVALTADAFTELVLSLSRVTEVLQDESNLGRLWQTFPEGMKLVGSLRGQGKRATATVKILDHNGKCHLVLITADSLENLLEENLHQREHFFLDDNVKNLENAFREALSDLTAKK